MKSLDRLLRYFESLAPNRVRITNYMGTAGALWGLISLMVVCVYRQNKYVALWNILAMFCLVTWAIVPPIWFWFDWVWLYGPEIPPGRASEIKHTHDVSRNIWIAVGVVLVGLYSDKWGF